MFIDPIACIIFLRQFSSISLVNRIFLNLLKKILPSQDILFLDVECGARVKNRRNKIYLIVGNASNDQSLI